MEVNLRNALAISGGDISILFQSKISLVLWVLAIAVAVLPFCSAGGRSAGAACGR